MGLSLKFDSPILSFQHFAVIQFNLRHLNSLFMRVEKEISPKNSEASNVPLHWDNWKVYIQSKLEGGKIEKVLESICMIEKESIVDFDSSLWIQLSAEWHLLKDDKRAGIINTYEFYMERTKLIQRINNAWKNLKTELNS